MTIHNITDLERAQAALITQLSQGRDLLAARVEALEAALHEASILLGDLCASGRATEATRDLSRKVNSAVRGSS